MGGALDDRAGLLHFGEFQGSGSGDVDQDAAGSVDGSGFEQGRGDRPLSGFAGTARATGVRGAHDGVAHARHDGFHVGEVAVDDAGNGDDVGDALHALTENVVGDAEGFEEAGVFGNAEQLFIGNDDRGVDRFHQLGDAPFGLLHAAFAFEGEGLGHDRDGERTHFTGERGDDGGGAGAGASAETGGDEDHVSPFEGLDNFVGIFEGGLASDFGVGASAEAIGQFHTELQFHGRL